jgi:hypothetical protein
MIPRAPTSEALERLLSDPSRGQVTLAWMMDRLGERSFGIVLLLLAMLGLLPGISPLASLLILVIAVQMVRGKTRPVLPRRIAERAVDERLLARLIRRVVPVLRWLERFIRPRWPTPLQSTKRVVGGSVLLLGIGLLTPVPFSNVPPALTIGLIAVAYLEEDGALLCVALAATVVLAILAAALAWETLGAFGLVQGML